MMQMRLWPLLLAVGVGCVEEGRGRMPVGRATQIGDEGLTPGSCARNINSVYGRLPSTESSLSGLARPYLGEYTLDSVWWDGAEVPLTLSLRTRGRGQGFGGVGDDCESWGVFELSVSLSSDDGSFDEYTRGQLQFVDVREGDWVLKGAVAQLPIRELNGSFRSGWGDVIELLIAGGSVQSWPFPGRINLVRDDGQVRSLVAW
ncbi:MAG: hypothetical protein AAGA48_24620 [Myxococcota bacterium]